MTVFNVWRCGGRSGNILGRKMGFDGAKKFWGMGIGSFPARYDVDAFAVGQRRTKEWKVELRGLLERVALKGLKR